ncbi:hypothetical protein EJ02DRAFT_460555 [Clathrospora elynae]|uniref:Uncharacterized protein n=1 Tax=Clathrospora elynae TaxID=706981 RepID=A0A6A5S3N9_9PLEO|nr:hypothetical protein EJ02DRAFT_460555 [Clathrospora elynae]
MPGKDGKKAEPHYPDEELTEDEDKSVTAETEGVRQRADSSASHGTSAAGKHDKRSKALIPSAHTAEALRHVAEQSNPVRIAVPGLHLAKAIRAFGKKAKRAFDSAIEALRKICIIDVAKAAVRWMKTYPWEPAAILVPLILLACTPAFLGLAGFTAGGIAAGSIAAGAQVGIGSVVAGSIFEILTSAAMAGYGVPIVFGGVWVISSAVLAGFAAWKRGRTGGTGCGKGGHGDGNSNRRRNEGDGGGNDDNRNHEVATA